jgi:hypothetical protein
VGAPLPQDARSCAVAAEKNQTVPLVLIQTLNRVVDSLPTVNIGLRRKGIVNACRPTFFLKRSEYQLLRRGWLTELFYQYPADVKLTGLGIPGGHR